MSRILITGGTGVLGRELVSRLQQTGHTPRIMSRKSQPAALGAGSEWAQADIMTGEGLTSAVAGVDVIIHAASSARSNTQQTDVEGTDRLIKAASAAKVSHLIYISIVGIDRIPYSYYQSKVAAENVIRAGDVPWSILRATQFHDLIDMFLGVMIRYPIALVPTDTKYQVVDAGEVAAELVRVADCPPGGMLPDMGGPEVLAMGQMAKDWLAARHQRALIIPIRAPGGFAHALRNGYNTCPQNRQGKITWKQWLNKKYGTKGK
jgi:uncharacterized protein YbjT (DUF2867 family)